MGRPSPALTEPIARYLQLVPFIFKCHEHKPRPSLLHPYYNRQNIPLLGREKPLHKTTIYLFNQRHAQTHTTRPHAVSALLTGTGRFTSCPPTRHGPSGYRPTIPEKTLFDTGRQTGDRPTQLYRTNLQRQPRRRRTNRVRRPRQLDLHQLPAQRHPRIGHPDQDPSIHQAPLPRPLHLFDRQSRRRLRGPHP